ncbi:MAG: conserved hypothetical exported protein [Rhizobium sp.]|nr:conserved hypothetical exported protein [Rhizobium sp.]
MRLRLLASLMLHALILLAFILVKPPASPKPQPDPGINVEIVEIVERPKPEPQINMEEKAPPVFSRSKIKSQLTAEKIIEAARMTAPRETRPAPDDPVTATELYSAKVLDEPNNMRASEALRGLATDERIIQLCNIEAMEQVQRWKTDYQPDFVVAYAMRDTRIAAAGMEAEGAAFRSRRTWYNIRFKCDVSPGIDRVVSFAFLVGKPIPKAEWGTHNLPADNDAAD